MHRTVIVFNINDSCWYQSLCIAYCSLPSIDDLQCLISLQSLDLRSNQITGMSLLYEVCVLFDREIKRNNKT